MSIVAMLLGITPMPMPAPTGKAALPVIDAHALPADRPMTQKILDVLRDGPATAAEIALEIGDGLRPNVVSARLCQIELSGRVRRVGVLQKRPGAKGGPSYIWELCEKPIKPAPAAHSEMSRQAAGNSDDDVDAAVLRTMADGPIRSLKILINLWHDYSYDEIEAAKNRLLDAGKIILVGRTNPPDGWNPMSGRPIIDEIYGMKGGAA